MGVCLLRNLTCSKSSFSNNKFSFRQRKGRQRRRAYNKQVPPHQAYKKADFCVCSIWLSDCIFSGSFFTWAVHLSSESSLGSWSVQGSYVLGHANHWFESDHASKFLIGLWTCLWLLKSLPCQRRFCGLQGAAHHLAANGSLLKGTILSRKKMSCKSKKLCKFSLPWCSTVSILPLLYPKCQKHTTVLYFSDLAWWLHRIFFLELCVAELQFEAERGCSHPENI